MMRDSDRLGDSGAPDTPHRTGWAPLRSQAFRRLWSAQFVSNVGSWMQTVAAQWVMLSLTSSALLIGAIPAASSIPSLLLAVPAGTLGDLVDRRRLILGSQLVMLVAAAALAVLAGTGGLTPGLLIAMLFAIGVGGAASASTWQTLQPELVPATDRPEAVALGSVNQNLARAVGPAVGGALLAATSAAAVFWVNAGSFIAVVVVVAITVLPARPRVLPREHAVDALRAGGRFVANSPQLLALIGRNVAFILPASALWALLPIVARGRLGLGAGGYGALLGCVGIGAMLSATFGPGLRRRFASRVLYAASATVIAAAALVVAWSHQALIDGVALVAAGGGWISGIGVLGAAYQAQLPAWVKARGLSYYLVAFQGSNAIGGLLFGAVAQSSSVSTAFVVIAVVLVAVQALTWTLALPDGAAAGGEIAKPVPLPQLDADREHRPAMVMIAWRVDPSNVAAFAARTADLRRIRRRTGATHWRLYEDIDTPGLLVESFTVGSWTEHERQHTRLSTNDEDALRELDELLASDAVRSVRHYVAATRRPSIARRREE